MCVTDVLFLIRKLPTASWRIWSPKPKVIVMFCAYYFLFKACVFSWFWLRVSFHVSNHLSTAGWHPYHCNRLQTPLDEKTTIGCFHILTIVHIQNIRLISWEGVSQFLVIHPKNKVFLVLQMIQNVIIASISSWCRVISMVTRPSPNPRGPVMKSLLEKMLPGCWCLLRWEKTLVSLGGSLQLLEIMCTCCRCFCFMRICFFWNV